MMKSILVALLVPLSLCFQVQIRTDIIQKLYANEQSSIDYALTKQFEKDGGKGELGLSLDTLTFEGIQNGFKMSA